MTKDILLARPHPFIISAMEPFLEENGFNPIKIKDLSELNNINLAKIKGVIISTAVSSSFPCSIEQVFEKIHQINPLLPITFVGLIEFDRVKKNISVILEKFYAQFELTPIVSKEDIRSKLVQNNLFVYVSKNDLDNSPELTAVIIDNHFKRI